MFKAAHDGEKLYVRVSGNLPPLAATRPTRKNEVKLTMLFDGGGTVEGAELNGCWACRTDMRTMKDGKDDKKTKYIKGADLASGKFYDLIQFRSGKGEKPVDGYVAEALHGKAARALSRRKARRKATSGSSPSSGR